MKTAREVAHRFLGWAANILSCKGRDENHNEACDRLTAAIEARDEEWNQNINVNNRAWERELGEARAEVKRLREALITARQALDIIEEYEIDWAKGTGDNVATLQNIATRALARTAGSTSPATPVPALPPADDPDDLAGEPDWREAYRRWWNWASENNVPMQFACKECGDGAASDEDGCCASCGWTVVVVPKNEPANPPRDGTGAGDEGGRR